MGVDAGDFDGDGDEDLFMTHLTGETNTLYVNDGGGLFEDRTVADRARPRRACAYTGFGTAWFDYDNDGWLDLLVVNGAVRTIEPLARSRRPLPARSSRNQLFHNLGRRRAFEEVTDRARAAFELTEVSRGAAFGDLDDDGDVDVLVVNNNNGPARLLVNRAAGDTPWLGLVFRDGAGGAARSVPGSRSSAAARRPCSGVSARTAASPPPPTLASWSVWGRRR